MKAVWINPRAVVVHQMKKVGTIGAKLAPAVVMVPLFFFPLKLIISQICCRVRLIKNQYAQSCRALCVHVCRILIYVPFVCACEFMCLACLWEITERARAAVAHGAKSENGVFCWRVSFSLQSRGEPQNPARQAVCVSLPV